MLLHHGSSSSVRNLEAYVAAACAFRSEARTHVTVVASIASHWEPGVQDASNQHRRMCRKKLLSVNRKGARWPQQALLAVEERTAREKLLDRFWKTFVKDDSDLADAIQPKAALSCAMAVMDRVGGWRIGQERSQNGEKIAASLWIYTRAFFCNGQQHMETFRINKRNSIMEARQLVCVYSQNNHDWISEFSL